MPTESGKQAGATRYNEKRLFIGNLANEQVTEADLRAIFSKYGKVTEVVIRRSFGFIQFETEEAAKQALSAENGRLIGPLRVGLLSFLSLFHFLFSHNTTKKKKKKKRFAHSRQQTPKKTQHKRANHRAEKPPQTISKSKSTSIQQNTHTFTITITTEKRKKREKRNRQKRQERRKRRRRERGGRDSVHRAVCARVRRADRADAEGRRARGMREGAAGEAGGGVLHRGVRAQRPCEVRVCGGQGRRGPQDCLPERALSWQALPGLGRHRRLRQHPHGLRQRARPLLWPSSSCFFCCFSSSSAFFFFFLCS